MSDKTAKIPDFEKSLTELESLVEKMEHGELTLEQSLEHYERGVRLTQTCQQALDQAQLRLDLLSESDIPDASESDDADG